MPRDGSRDSDDVLDEALAILEPTAPHYRPNGFANHGPMAAEALVRLGRRDDVVPWVAQYRARLDDDPGPGTPVAPTDERSALGDPRRFPDWRARFECELAERPWSEVVGTFGARLAPGASADAYHGVIRTAHAVRALEHAETPLRLGELARGLSLWASTYQELPGTPGSPGTLAPGAALARVTTLTDEERGETASIVEGLGLLDAHPEFVPVVDLVAVDDPDATLTATASAFAGALLDHAHDFSGAIEFCHAITGPSAVQLLLPHLAPADRITVTQYAWQGSAGIYAVYAGEPKRTSPEVLDVDDVIDRAVAIGDEHAIKLAEACTRQHRISGDPDLLAAARRVTDLLGG